MQTAQELLEQLKGKLQLQGMYEHSYCKYTHEEHTAIISLLTQQVAGAQPDLSFAKWLEDNTVVVYEDKITLYRYCDRTNEYGNYTLDDIFEEYKELQDTDTTQQVAGEVQDDIADALEFMNDELGAEAGLRQMIDDWCYKQYGNDGLEKADLMFTALQKIIYPSQQVAGEEKRLFTLDDMKDAYSAGVYNATGAKFPYNSINDYFNQVYKLQL